ncbi:Zinc finger protein 862, partial [Stegodyphus mimosarum]
MIDESTDISVDHKLIIYVKYLKNNESQNSLWANLKLSGECNADAMKEIIIKFLKEKKVPLSKVAGLSTDGAAVMMGKNNGINKKFQDMIPGLLHYHCIAHCLALTFPKLLIEYPYFKAARELGSLYAYFHSSNIRIEN